MVEGAQKLSDEVGVLVEGLDLTVPISEELKKELINMVHEHRIVCFRNPEKPL